MKILARILFLLAGMASTIPAKAQTLTWDANGATAGQTNGAGAWIGSGTNLWWNGTANQDWVSGSDVIFGGTASAAGAVTLASSTVVNSFTFNTAYTGTYTLGTAGSTITLNNGITKNSGSAAVTIISPILLGGAQTWSNNSSTALSATGGVNNGGNTIIIDGSGSTSFNSQLAAVIVTGAGGITKNGSGTLTLGGAGSFAPAHDYSGTTTINAGAIMVQNYNLGTGNLTITNGYLDSYFGGTFTRAIGTGAGQFQITGGTSGFSSNGNTGTAITINNNAATEVTWGSATFNPASFVLQASTAQVGSTLTFNNKIDLNGADRTISTSGGTTGAARAVIAGQIRNGIGTAGIIKNGAGALLLSSASNAWNGNTAINAGLLDLGAMTNASIAGGTGRTITVVAGASVRFNALSNTFLNRIVETGSEIGVMTGTTNNNLDFSSSTGANLPNAFLGNYATNGAKMEYSGTITAAADAYRLGAPLNSGLLGITNSSPLTGTQGLIIGTGSAELVGAKTFSGGTTIRNGARLGLATAVANTPAAGLQNSVLDTGTVSSTGTIWLESLTSGQITGGLVTTSAVFGGLSGSRNLASFYSTTTGANNSTATAVLSVIGFTLNPGTGVTTSYSGIIANFAAGTTITVAGTAVGTQILSGANTYTGATTINGGTLLVNGTHTGGGAYAVSAGTLGGSGSIPAAVSVAAGATLTGGNPASPGSNALTLTQGFTTVATSNIAVRLLNNIPDVAGTNPASNSFLNIAGGTTTIDAGTRFVLSGNPALDGVTNYQYRIAAGVSAQGGFPIASPSQFDTTNLTGAGAYTFSVSQTGTDVFLNAAVPEPTTILGIAALGLGMIRLRRRLTG